MILLFPAIIHWGEEPGWRGFAQWRMQTVYGALRTSLIVGLLHGVWHLPAFLLRGGPMAMGPFDPQWFVVDVLDIMLSAVLLAWIFNLAARQHFGGCPLTRRFERRRWLGGWASSPRVTRSVEPVAFPVYTVGVSGRDCAGGDLHYQRSAWLSACGSVATKRPYVKHWPLP
jgi:hypothetical protein